MITKTNLSIEEATETLTGFEEQAIEQRFGATLEELLATKPTFGLRALAMVLAQRDLERQDVKDPKGKAYSGVMNMSIKQVADFFPDAPDDLDPDQPETPAGEGDSSAD